MWNVVPPYLVGGALATTVFVWVAFVPEPGLVLILVGASPWLARVVPFLRGLDIRNRATSVVCGATVTAAQLVAGASGPLLDAFYLSTDTDHRRIVATKAVTQTIGHIVKVVYYGVRRRTTRGCGTGARCRLADRGCRRGRDHRCPDRHVAARTPRYQSLSTHHHRGGAFARGGMHAQGRLRPLDRLKAAATDVGRMSYVATGGCL